MGTLSIKVPIEGRFAYSDFDTLIRKKNNSNARKMSRRRRWKVPRKITEVYYGSISQPSKSFRIDETNEGEDSSSSENSDDSDNSSDSSDSGDSGDSDDSSDFSDSDDTEDTSDDSDDDSDDDGDNSSRRAFVFSESGLFGCA